MRKVLSIIVTMALLSVVSFWSPVLAQIVPAFAVTDFSGAAQTSGCQPFIVFFSDSSTFNGSPVPYKSIANGDPFNSHLWLTGNQLGTTSNLYKPSFAYNNAGTYTVTLIITVDGVNYDTVSQNITVYPIPQVGFTASVRQGCNPLTVTFCDTTSGSTSWIWDTGDGYLYYDSCFTHTYTLSSSANNNCYSVTLIATNQYGCSNNVTRSNYICINRPPVADFTADSLVLCDGPYVVNFSDLSVSDNPLTYYWTFGDGSNSNQQNPTHTYADTTRSYNVTLIVRDTLCNTSGIKVKSAYIKSSSLSVSFDSDKDTICVGESITFSDSIKGTYSNVEWQFGPPGATSTNIKPTYTYNTPGLWSVTLTVHTSSGCVYDTTIVDKILVVPNPTANFTSSNTPNSCQAPYTVNFQQQASPGVSYMWYFQNPNPGFVSTQPNPSFTYNNPGSYSVRLVVTDSAGCSSTITKNNFVSIGTTVIDFTMDSSNGCIPLTVNFTDVSTSFDPIVNWSWDFSDGGTSSQQNPSHTFTTVGTWSVCLTAVTQNGCVGTRCYDVNAGIPPTAIFTANPVVTCVDAPVAFTNQSIGPIDSYLWEFEGPGGPTSTGPNPPPHPYETPGTYNAQLTVSYFGCSHDTSLVIQVLNPDADFTYSVNCATTGEVSFMNTSTGGQFYNWNFGDNTSSTLENPLHSYASTGNYVVTLSVTDTSTGCTSEQKDTILVSVINVSFLESPTSGCAPLLVSFSSTTTGNQLTYFWNFGDPASGTSNVASVKFPRHTYTSAGTYTVTLVVTDINGCKDTLVKPNLISVSDLTANFTANITHGCMASDGSVNAPAITFSDQSTNVGTPPLTWSWDFGDSTTSTAQNPTHTYTAPGLYDVTLIVQNADGCRDTFIRDKYIDINQPQADFTSPFNLYCAGQQVQFVNASTGDGLSYFWNFGNPNATDDTSQAKNPIYAYIDTGYYDVSLWVTDVYGCQDSIIKNGAIHISIPDLAFIADDTFRFCPPQVVNFSNFANFDTARVDSVFWDFGDNSTSTVFEPSHIYNRAGSFTVCLVVYFENGCSDSLCAPNYINIGGATGSVSVFPDSVGCAPLDVCMAANATGAAAYFWLYGDGASSSGSDTACYTYASPGLYQPAVVLVDTQIPVCQYVLPYHDTIKVDSIIADFDFDLDTVCQLEPVSFFDSSYSVIGRDIVAWDWDFGDGTSDTVQNPKHGFAHSGLATVTLTAYGPFGCPGSVSKQLLVLSKPTAAFDATDTSGCEELTVTYSDQSVPGDGPIDFWFWDFGDPSVTTDTSSLTAPSAYFYSDTGHYTVSLVVGDDNGCADTALQLVNVFPNPAGISGNDTLELCLYDTIVLEGGLGYQTYNWTPGVYLSDSTVAQPLAFPIDTTTFYLQTVDTTGCFTDDSIYVAVNPLPQLEVFPHPDTAVCLGDTVQLMSNYNGNLIAWSPAAGLNSASIADPIAVPQQTTTYRAFTIDSNSCKSIDSVTIQLNIFDPNFLRERVCLGQPNNFIGRSTSSDRPIVASHWDFGDPSTNADTAFTKNTHYVYPDSGLYFVTLIVYDAIGCSDTITKGVRVDYPPLAFALSDTIVCFGEPAILFGGGGDTIFWTPPFGLSNPDSFVTIAMPPFTTRYVAHVTNGVCPFDTASVTVGVNPPVSLQTIDEVTIVRGSSIDLTTTAPTADSIVWTPADSLSCTNCLSPTATPYDTTTYYVTVYDNHNCPVVDSVTINVEVRCDETQIFVGNGFTPNGDGNNDVAFARLYGIQKLNYFRIFDRWGNLMFETTDRNVGWDGKNKKGEQLNSGVYVYVVEAVCFDGQTLVKTGNVTIIK